MQPFPPTQKPIPSDARATRELMKWVRGCTADEVPDPGALEFSLMIGQQSRQAANTRDLIFDVPRLIEYASATYTLHPGDIIMTGTPEGVGPVAAGDIMHCTMSRIGSMSVAVHAMPYPAVTP